MRRTSAIIAITVALYACQYDPYTSEYATAKPDAVSLIGRWHATQDTLKKLSGGPYGNLKPSIEVLGDGSIRFEDMPNTWKTLSGEGAGKGERFAGRWELAQHQAQWWGLSVSDANWVCSGCLMVLRNRPPHMLVLRYGDPDLGWGYEFERDG